MAKIQTQESALDPILREREEWVRAAQVDTGALQDNVRRLQQSQSDLAR